MKAFFRAIIGVALVAVLFLTASGEGPARLNEPADAQPLPTAPDVLKDMVVFREGVQNTLLCLLSTPGGRAGSEIQPVVLFLLSVDENNDFSLLNIPVGTRVPVRETRENGDTPIYRYDTPVAQYLLGMEDGTEGRRMAESISEMMGGIAIDNYLLMTVEGLERFVNRLDGVYVVKYPFFSGVAGGTAQNDAVKLTGPAISGYILSSSTGTDVGALERQNHALAALIERAVSLGVLMSDMEEICGSTITHNLSDAQKAQLDTAFLDADAKQIEENATETLWGSARLIDGQSWLPDKAKIKEYVLKHFYTDGAGDL